MPVYQVQAGMIVEPSICHSAQQEDDLGSGVLQLAPREKIHGKYMPADAFFASLAAERGSLALGVVLSARWRRRTEWRRLGGRWRYRSEASAKFDSMPSTAVATGQVDFILPPEKLPWNWQNQHPSLCHPPSDIKVEEPKDGSDPLSAILAMLDCHKVDFTYYKRTTVNRRLGRRMLLQLERLEDYVRYLRAHPAEVKALYQELLISHQFFETRKHLLC